MEWFARIFRSRKNRSPQWQEIEYFNESWKSRIGAMARFIEPGKSVLDLGSGKEWLKEFLPPGCKYIPVDYKDRGNGNFVSDFNKKQFPDTTADIAFISGCFEYITDYDWFAAKVSEAANKIIISYNITDTVSDRKTRDSLAWKNHLSEKEFVSVFTDCKMKLKQTDRSVNKNPIFIFEKN